jgi:hypothetical protein
MKYYFISIILTYLWKSDGFFQSSRAIISKIKLLSLSIDTKCLPPVVTEALNELELFNSKCKIIDFYLFT